MPAVSVRLRPQLPSLRTAQLTPAARTQPLFFTHYGPSTYNKNWVYQSDNWPLATRWEQLVAMRDRINHVEELTWNDYGESHCSSCAGSLQLSLLSLTSHADPTLCPFPLMLLLDIILNAVAPRSHAHQ